MGDIIIPGFPTGMLVPGIYINVELGRQPPSAAGVVRKVLLVAQNAEKGTAGELHRILRLRSNTPKNPGSDTDSAEGLYGRNETDPLQTRLYWLAKAAFAANPSVALYALKVDGTTTYAKMLDPSNTDSPLVRQRFHYIVVDEVGQNGTLVDYLEGMADPLVGYRQQGIVGHHKKTPPTAPDVSKRSPRLQYVWSPQSDSDGPPAAADIAKGKSYYGMMLAAATASIRSRHESIDPAVNLCMETVPGVPPAPAGNATTKSALNGLLEAGFTPLVTQGTSTVILRSVTTAANPDTSVNTYPVLDTSKVTVTDFVADDIEMKMVNRYTGFKLAPDTDVPPPSMTATPKGIKNSLLEWLRQHEKAGRITTVTDLAERVLVEIDADVPGRVNFQIPEDVIEILAVGAGNIIQIG